MDRILLLFDVTNVESHWPFKMLSRGKFMDWSNLSCRLSRKKKTVNVIEWKGSRLYLKYRDL